MKQTTRASNGFIVTSVSEGGGLRLPPEAAGRGHVAVVYDGSLEETIDGTRRRYRQSHVEFWPAGRHAGDIRRTPGSMGLIIEFEAWRLASFIPLFPQPFDPGYVNRAEFGPVLSQVFREFHESDPASTIGLEGALLDMVTQASRWATREAQTPDWLVAAIEIVDRTYRDQISLSTVARSVDVHPTRLAEAFRNAKQMSVGEYIRRRRVDFAVALLAHSDCPIGTIAADSGFYDHAHLTRAFRSVMGMTPLEYRRRTKKALYASAANATGNGTDASV